MADLTFYFILLFLPYLCVLRAVEGARNSSNIRHLARIIGGSTTTVDELKYIVQLHINNGFACGGSLISEIHVITAGHCVTYSSRVLPASLYTVHGGTTYRKDAGVVRQVKKISVPENFRYGNKLTNDIAVITLVSPMRGPNIETIPLCKSAVPVGAAVRVSGWGITKAGGAFPDQLHTVILNMISKEKCKNSFGKGAITPTMICAMRKGHGNCMGDSGGPLVFNGQVCGIVSFGKKCATAQYPGVYTSVYQMRSFISKKMNE